MSSSQYERDLLATLESKGWAGMRAPASGSRAGDSPDVLVGKKHTHVQKTELVGHLPTSLPLAIELKSTQGAAAYVDADEVAALTRFADAFGATPMLAIRPKRGGSRAVFYVVRIHNARETPEGNYALPIGDAHDRASIVVKPETETMDAEVHYVE